MGRAKVLVTALAVVTIAATCASAPFSVRLRPQRTGTLTWQPCGRIQCATLTVPLDHEHPDARRVHLALARRPASGHRLGVLLTNPGGPGAPGTSLVSSAVEVFGRDVLSHFDIVSWDPRGTGRSDPIICLDNLDFFFAVDRSPDDPTEVEQNVNASKRLVDACEARAGARLPFMSTHATVRDMDAIRVALGANRVSYVGFSYGTYLGALYADAYPRHVRAIVLDGSVDPTVSYTDAAVAQAVGFERALDAFLADCPHDRRCELARGGDPRVAFDHLLASVDAEPEPAEVGGKSRVLGPGEADIGVATALYAGRDGWPVLAHALVEAAQGDGGPLLALSDQYTNRHSDGTYDNEAEAFYATGCLDGPAPRTVPEVQQLADSAARVAPHFGATTVWLGLPCTFWPVLPDARPAPVHADGAPPILVVGTTNDPATPFAWAQSLARQLRSGRLLTLEGEGHTAYGRGNDCIDRAVDRYLIDGRVPADGTRCTA